MSKRSDLRSTMWQKPFQIGRFKFLEFIDRGGMAEVYRVKVVGAEGFEKELAVKRILPAKGQEEQVAKMFADEARLCSALTHPNITQVIDFVVADGEHLLIMEYVHGKNLAQVLAARKEPIPLALTLFIGSEVAKGLDYAHGKADAETGIPLGIVHRDISPQNIMLSFDGAVKLLDFGIAKNSLRGSQTDMGQIRGKLFYMSPEQVNNEPLDQRTDVFSLGTVLFELLTGRMLFASDNPMATMDLIDECKIPSLEDLAPTVPPAVRAIVLKSLARDPATRYQTAGELQVALQEQLNLGFPQFSSKEVRRLLREHFPGSENRSSSWSELPKDQQESVRTVIDGLERLELEDAGSAAAPTTPAGAPAVVTEVRQRWRVKVRPIRATEHEPPRAATPQAPIPFDDLPAEPPPRDWLAVPSWIAIGILILMLASYRLTGQNWRYWVDHARLALSTWLAPAPGSVRRPSGERGSRPRRPRHR